MIRRFIQNQQFRFRNQYSGKVCTYLLTAGKLLPRTVLLTVDQTETLQDLVDLCFECISAEIFKFFLKPPVAFDQRLVFSQSWKKAT